MSNRIRYLFQSITVSKIVIFVFLVIYCGFYYQQYLNLISFSYLLLGCAFLYNLVKHKAVIHLQFIIISILFVLYSFISSLWANDFSLSNNSVVQLAKSSFIAICFITLIDSKEKFKWAFFSLSLAGFIYGLLFVQNVNVANLGANRIMVESENDFLPNVNTVGLVLSLSFSYFFFYFFYEKKCWSLCFASLTFLLIFLLGSRKSIISLFVCIVCMLFKLDKSSKIKLVVLLCALVFLLFVYIPSEYLSFVSDRLAQLNLFSNRINDLDSSDEMRIMLLKGGVDYSINSPVIGNGYYTFSQLFKNDYGVALYSHNNFIETFVGGGVIGFVIYYSLYFIIASKIKRKVSQYDYSYLIFVMCIVLLFNHLSIVVLQERFVWLLLAILYTGAKYLENNQYNENRISCR